MKWTKRDVTLLRAEYPSAPILELAEMLGRNVGAVKRQASVLGLRKVKRPKTPPQKKVLVRQFHHVGMERERKDGVMMRKVRLGTKYDAGWRAVHVLEWEAIHGPVPQGYHLERKVRPGEWTVANLHLVSLRDKAVEANKVRQEYPPALNSMVKLRSLIQKEVDRLAKLDP